MNVSQPHDLPRILSYRRKLLQSIDANVPSVAMLNLLQDGIRDATGKTIGFNTLRRFFGLLPVVSPSTGTWRAFDTYLNATVTHLPIQSTAFMGNWSLVHRLNVMVAQRDVDALASLLIGLKGQAEFALVLGYVTNHFIAAKNTVALKRLYSEDALFEDYESYADYLAEIVGVFIRNLDSEGLVYVTPVMILPNFRKSILYFDGKP